MKAISGGYIKRHFGSGIILFVGVIRVVFCLILFVSGIILSPVIARQHNLTFEHITTRHGLPGSRVYIIEQDRQGFLWIGTESGLSRYDGYSFTTYRPPRDSDAVGSNSAVLSLFEDDMGTLWIGLRDGLYIIERGSERMVRFELENAGPDLRQAITSIFVQDDGIVWLGTYSGLYRLHRTTGVYRHYTHDPLDRRSLTGNYVSEILEDRDGRLWVGTDEGLNRYDPATETFARYVHDPSDTNSLSHNRITDLYEDRAGALWVATAGGLNRITRGEIVRYVHDPDDPTSLSHNTVETVTEDRNGTLWVGTWGGAAGGALHALDRETGHFARYRHVPHDPGSLRRNYAVLSLLEDRSGVLWIGTGGGYLHKLDSTTRHFVRYRRGPGSPGSQGGGYVFALIEDRSGKIWIGTDTGLERFDRKTGRFQFYGNELEVDASSGDETVRSLYEDHGGKLWIGTETSLARFDRETNKFRHFQPGEHGSSPVWITEIYEDRQGRLWVGTDRGLQLFDRGQETFVFSESGYAAGYVQTLYQDRDGLLWVGTKQGLHRYDPEDKQFVPLPEALTPLRTCDIRVVQEDRAGRLWVGTVGEGLWLLDFSTGTVTNYTQEAGLPNNVVLDILEDRQGNLWIRSLNGVSRFDYAEQRFANFEEARALGVNLNEWGATCRNSAGEFIFAGEDGLVFFRPEEIKENTVPPQVMLTGFSLFNQSVKPDARGPLKEPLWRVEEIRLAHNQNDVSFNFVALHFSRPESNRYKYILEPYDEEWREGGTQRRATYTNLSPGTYVFRVKAANADGVWNEEGADIRIVIVPPFWARTWFVVLCACALILILVGSIRFRERRLQARNKQLALHVEERTRQLLLEKRKTEMQARRLQELNEVKSQFFADLSHEFRTPLTLITGPLKDLLDGRYGTLGPEIREQHQLMYHSARRLLRLITELLDLAKLEAGKMTLEEKPGELVTFLRDLTRAFAPLAERKRITLQCRAEMPELWRYFDHGKLESVFSNLLSNALKFTPAGGKVWITVRVRSKGEPSMTEIVVKDTGPGIPRERLSAIFDRFEQASTRTLRRQGGIGLGLSLTKELVELHGGKILVESELGFGSAFIVRLPLRTAAPVTPESEEVDFPDPDAIIVTSEIQERAPKTVTENTCQTEENLPTEKVLIVEDNADVREYLREHLDKTYSVLEAETGLEAWETVRQERPDVVVCDVMMPGFSGFDLCQRIKSDDELSLTPVVLLTALADETERLRGLELGADDYLSKPFNVDELNARLNNLIRSRRQMRSAFSRQVVVQPSGVVAGSEDEAFLENVLSTVEAHLSDSTFNIGILADSLGMSRRQLHRRIHALTGESPTDLLRRLRLDRARQLLDSRSATISEVAYAVGYSSPSNFARAFREQFGLSPSEYIDRHVTENTSSS